MKRSHTILLALGTILVTFPILGYAQNEVQGDSDQMAMDISQFHPLQIDVAKIEIPEARQGCTGSPFCTEDGIKETLAKSLVMEEGVGAGMPQESLVALLILTNGDKVELYWTQSAMGMLVYPDGRYQVLIISGP